MTGQASAAPTPRILLGDEFPVLTWNQVRERRLRTVSYICTA